MGSARQKFSLGSRQQNILNYRGDRLRQALPPERRQGVSEQGDNINPVQREDVLLSPLSETAQILRTFTQYQTAPAEVSAWQELKQ